MNVLIFVMTMIMLLSLMTYSRLESYRNSQAFQVIFKDYMEGKERGYINGQAESTYKKIKASKQEDKNTAKAKKIDASPRIGLALFLDPEREAKGQEWGQTKNLFKNIVHVLYEKQPFFKKIEQDRPSFVDELIPAITQSIDELSQKKKPKNASGLANLKLKDPELDLVFYKMLHGASYTDVTKEKKQAQSAKNEKLEEADMESSDDSEDFSKEADEFKSPEGYYSLLDFITVNSEPSVRVYLASQEVLQAIFHDPATVNAIIEERQRLFRQANNGEESNQLGETFKNQFLKMKDPAIEDDSLNFSVSKTNPKYYK